MNCQTVVDVQTVDKSTEVKRVYMKNGDVLHSDKVCIISEGEE